MPAEKVQHLLSFPVEVLILVTRHRRARQLVAQSIRDVNIDTTLNVYTQVLDGSVRAAVRIRCSGGPNWKSLPHQSNNHADPHAESVSSLAPDSYLVVTEEVAVDAEVSHVAFKRFLGLTSDPSSGMLSGHMATRDDGDRLELLQGTLDLLILRTLIFGPEHGQGIARAIQTTSDDELLVEHGALYPALQRLEERGWISAKWGVSANNRRARFYSLTAAGRKQLVRQTDKWKRLAGAIARILDPDPAKR